MYWPAITHLSHFTTKYRPIHGKKFDHNSAKWKVINSFISGFLQGVANKFNILPYWIYPRLPSETLLFWYSMPLKSQPPVKSSNHWLTCLHVKFKGVPVDGINNRTNNSSFILCNPERMAKSSYQL